VNGFLSALAFLTRLPVPARAGKLEPAVVWLPVVGLVLGVILALADRGLSLLPLSGLVQSVLLVALLLALTGALHADGLMDTCDGAFVIASPERRLEIMRDPRAGAFGVVGLVCVVLLKVASVEALSDNARAQALVLAPMLGRWSIVLLATCFPYGRASGLGAPLKKAATARALLLASILPVAACLIAWPIGPIVGIIAAATALLLARWLMTVLPGLTGDNYGASCELVETVVWLAAAPLARALL
jgi:adenosylcobinamide-GDP ribazoletransferase